MLEDPLGRPLHVVSKYVGHLDFAINLDAELLDPSHALARLAVALGELARGAKDEPGDRVVVIGDGLAAESARLQRDGAAPSKRIQYSRGLVAVSGQDQRAGDPEHLRPCAFSGSVVSHRTSERSSSSSAGGGSLLFRPASNARDSGDHLAMNMSRRFRSVSSMSS